MPKYSWIKGPLDSNKVVSSTQLNGDIKVMIKKIIMPIAWFNWNELRTKVLPTDFVYNRSENRTKNHIPCRMLICSGLQHLIIF